MLHTHYAATALVPRALLLSSVFFRVDVAWPDTRQRHVHMGTYKQRETNCPNVIFDVHVKLYF